MVKEQAPQNGPEPNTTDLHEGTKIVLHHQAFFERREGESDEAYFLRTHNVGSVAYSGGIANHGTPQEILTGGYERVPIEPADRVTPSETVRQESFELRRQKPEGD